MENAVDALKIAFAVFVFVIALTVSMVAFGQAKDASEHVFYMTDKTNFYDLIFADEKRKNGRIVSAETIVPTLYRYYKENFNIVIIPKNPEMVLNTTENKLLKAREKETGETQTAVIFNLEEEIKYYNKDYKNAPWLGNANVDTKKRVDIELRGKADPEHKEENIINQVVYEPQVKLDGGLLNYLKSNRFREYFLEQRFSGKEIVSGDNESLELVKGNSKIWIIYKEE